MRWLPCVVALSLSGCASAGPYSYSRTYSPLDAEEEAEDGATEYDPVMVQRLPHEWKGKKVAVFGVVRGRSDGPGGRANLTLGVRSLAPRNLCEEADEETCRVTVSDREHAVVHALVELRGDDEIGRTSVGPGSLVRVVGLVSDDVDSQDAAPVIRATYYRHWPRNFFVTTAARSYMRR
jgi:hypothetical protein